MKLSTKIAAFAAAGAIGLGIVAMPPTADASEEGRRNTAYALGAATLYLGLKEKWVPAVITGAGTAYAVKRLDDAIDERHARERAYNSQSATSSSAVSSSSTARRATSAAPARSASAPRSASMSRAQLENHPYVQELISSAYTKGAAFGQQSGYEAGMKEGYKKGFDAGSGAAGFRPSGNPNTRETSAGSLFARVMNAR